MTGQRLTALVLGLLCMLGGAGLWVWQSSLTGAFPARDQAVDSFQLIPDGLPSPPAQGEERDEALGFAWPLLLLGTGALLCLASLAGLLAGRRRKSTQADLKDNDPPRPQSS